MKCKKIMTTLLAIALVFSAMVVIKLTTDVGFVESAQATPGVNEYGHSTTENVVVGTSYYTNTFYVNTSTWNAGTYYLFPPMYNCTTLTRSANLFEWDDNGYNGLYVVADGGINPLKPVNTNFVFDRAGMWIFDNGTLDSHHGNDPASYEGYIWVNTSTVYTITGPDNFNFGSNSTKSITVKEGDSAVDCNIALINSSEPGLFESCAFNQYTPGGVYTFGTFGNISAAGNYTIRAYRDQIDTYDTYNSPYYYTYQDENATEPHYPYGPGYGSGASFPAAPGASADYYVYNNLGPWDPPEKNATEFHFRVLPGTPSLSIPPANQTMFWGFSGEVNISIKDTSGDPISNYVVEVHNSDDVDITANLSITAYNGYCHISNGTWGTDGSTSFGENGTWYAYIWKDVNGDRNISDNAKAWNEEWNGTIEWRVQKAPGAQFKWINDGGGTFLNDGELPAIPAAASAPITIQFQIIGEDHTYYGAANQQMAMENITISGNAIFTGTLDKIPGVTFTSSTTWNVPIIPTMSQGGGTINIVATWENYGAINEVLSIGGTSYMTNGTIVTVTPNEFEIGNDQTFTIEVKYADGSTITSAAVYLYYIGDDDGGTDGKPITTIVSSDIYGFDGYTLGFNTTQQRANQTIVGFTNIRAPRNLTVYAMAYVGGTPVYGYAIIKMKPSSDLMVTFEAVDSPGTSTLLAGYKYSYFFINITRVDAVGNASGTPDPDDYTQITTKIVDENGNDVTTAIGSISSTDIAATTMGNDYIYKLSNEYMLRAGTYSVYAKNFTSDTEGNNGTLIVKQAHVECDKSPLIWSYDDNISATFTVTSEITGLALNGTLRIENMSWKPGDDHFYNKTYTNTSDSGNSTIDVDESDGLINGQITMHDITANFLPPMSEAENITFWFKPDLTGGGSGEYARCSGMVPVKVPTVRFDAPDGETGAKKIKYVRVGQTTDVVAYATGRTGTELLSDIYVGLAGQGVITNSTTGSVGTDLGKVTLSILPTTTGNITVDVGEDGRTVTELMVIVTSWELTITVDSRINENTAFTVTITRKGTTTAVEDAAVSIEGIGTVNTDADGKALFDGTLQAPEVTSDTTYTITASKDGFKEATRNVVVVNIPKLLISLNPTTAKQKASVKVTVSKDDANPAVNALVTLEGSATEYYTDGNGQVTITAPSKDGTYTITATFGTFQDGTIILTVKGAAPTPGFELLTLIIAIGIAFILLRRRRH